ncbi:dienelactone hydrolase family protein [Haloarcula sediminis]|uniref:dienelactone hydrolase family protein n=1 Tax=Haloarcula sediminis TaxID=3111777 RepID=UPI002D7738FE|nr:dienelactone hydrolase family protein [Haloarcula sp. CK38]
MSDPVVVPGGRDVRGRLDSSEADSAVVACPPHPRHGGSRSDPRLRAVSDALAPDIACLRFDYGPWDDQRGPALCAGDAEHALAWAGDRYDRLGLFGYSFGGGVALRAAARTDATLAACSVLAPAAEADALDGVDCPLQVVVGERDTAVDPAPVADRAKELGHTVERRPSGHAFHGDHDRVGRLVGAFLRARL